MSERYTRECHKKYMRTRCAQLGIAVPEKATMKQLQAVLDAYYKDAVVVYTESGVDIRQTDKPTSEYTVHFSITEFHTIRL